MSSLGGSMPGLERQRWLDRVAQNGYALGHASKELQSDREIVAAAVAQNGSALRYASKYLQSDREIVAAANAQNGSAQQHLSVHLQEQVAQSNTTTTTSLASSSSSAAAASSSSAAAATTDPGSTASDERPSKRAKIAEDHVEQRLSELMEHSQNVADVTQSTLSASHYLRCYDRCGQPFHGKGIWATPLATVLGSLPAKFQRAEWQTALQETSIDAGADELNKAGAACAYLWTKTPLNRMLQQVILTDDEELLGRVMPYLRCLNSYVLNVKVRLAATALGLSFRVRLIVVCCARAAAFAYPEDQGVPHLAYDEGASQAPIPWREVPLRNVRVHDDTGSCTRRPA